MRARPQSAASAPALRPWDRLSQSVDEIGRDQSEIRRIGERNSSVKASLGLGRIVALCDRPSALYQIH